MIPNRYILWRIATTKYNFPNIVDLEFLKTDDIGNYRCKLLTKMVDFQTLQRTHHITITQSEYQEYMFIKTIQSL